MNLLTGTPLIVVDMQNGFFNSKSDNVLPTVEALAHAWENAGWPIYFTKFINSPGSQWEDWIGWKRLRTSPETDIVQSLQGIAARNVVVEKQSYTSLTGKLADDLKIKSWKATVLCGIATDGCVLETAVDLFQQKVRPLVVTDACSSHAGVDIHRMGIELLRRFVGRSQLVDSQSVLGALQRASERT